MMDDTYEIKLGRVSYRIILVEVSHYRRVAEIRLWLRQAHRKYKGCDSKNDKERWTGCQKTVSMMDNCDFCWQ